VREVSDDESYEEESHAASMAVGYCHWCVVTYCL